MSYQRKVYACGGVAVSPAVALDEMGIGMATGRSCTMSEVLSRSQVCVKVINNKHTKRRGLKTLPGPNTIVGASV